MNNEKGTCLGISNVNLFRKFTHVRNGTRTVLKVIKEEKKETEKEAKNDKELKKKEAEKAKKETKSVFFVQLSQEN